MKRTTMWMLASALAAGLLVAGCGGDEDGDENGSTAVPEALTKEEYVAQGDEICALGTLRIGSEAQSRYGVTQAPPAQAKRFGQEVIAPTLRNQVLDQLRALPAPEGDEKTVAAIYAALEKAVGSMEANPALFADPNLGGVLDKPNRLAQAYGFTQCGQD